jgi:hypothetical protein
MGAFATFYQKGNDPLMVKLCQLVMTDEAFHHKFGKIWADRTIPQGDVVGFGVVLSELAKSVECLDGALVCEDGIDYL